MNLNHQPSPTNDLLNAIATENQLKNDAALSRFLDVAPPAISKLRYGRITVSAELMIRIHEKTGKSIADIKAALAS